MKLLALDTATERIALALAHGELSRTLDAEGGAAASANLIPQVLALLAEQGLRVADLDAVAFGRGPGAFTGLRTAVSVAQGLAFGAGKPVLAIDSLLIVADDARAQWLSARTPADGVPHDAAFDVWVAMDARMEQVYAAAYRWAEGVWRTRVEPALWSPVHLQAAWAAEPPVHLAGSALVVFGEQLAWSAAQAWPHQADRAAALLRLARAAWQAGGARPAEEALPVYLRDKVALTTAERNAQKAAQRGTPGVAPAVAQALAAAPRA